MRTAEIRRQARADKITVRTGVDSGLVWALRMRREQPVQRAEMHRYQRLLSRVAPLAVELRHEPSRRRHRVDGSQPQLGREFTRRLAGEQRSLTALGMPGDRPVGAHPAVQRASERPIRYGCRPRGPMPS